METNEEGEWEEGEEWSVTMTMEIKLQVCDEPSWESACEYMRREITSARYPFRDYDVEFTFS